MLASTLLGVKPSAKHDWFNATLFRDTKVFLDPYLIYSTPHRDFPNAYAELTQFFDVAYRLGAKSGGDLNTPAASKLKFMLRFPEPGELCLGYAAEGNQGAGTGD